MAAEIDHTKEFKAHAGTYEFFTKLMTRGTVISAIVAAIVVFLIAS